MNIADYFLPALERIHLPATLPSRALASPEKHSLLAKPAHRRKMVMRGFVLAKVLPYSRQVRSLFETFNKSMLYHL
ncbi:MAG: hypothetical protein ACLP2Y_13165 [Limisphaerales bacterium]